MVCCIAKKWEDGRRWMCAVSQFRQGNGEALFLWLLCVSGEYGGESRNFLSLE